MIIQLLAMLTGVILFVETSISSLTVGTLYRPVFDKLKIPREKLAYIADSSSAPTSILGSFLKNPTRSLPTVRSKTV